MGEGSGQVEVFAGVSGTGLVPQSPMVLPAARNSGSLGWSSASLTALGRSLIQVKELSRHQRKCSLAPANLVTYL